MTMLPPPPDAARYSAAAAMRVGVLAVFVLVFGLGAWAAFASIAGAVVASGKLRVETNQQVVQHPDGGVVADILVKEGDTVEAGQLLVRLDDRIARAELTILEGRLFEILARIGRLEAEQDDADAPRFGPELLEIAAARPEVALLVEGQRRLFAARRETSQREVEQLRKRQDQIGDEIVGTEAQIESLRVQIGFIESELVDQRALLAKGLTQTTRVLSLERENARLQGQFGALVSQIAQSRGRVTEIEIQLVGRDATRREEAIKELRDLRSQEAELRQQRLSSLETLDRLEVRAPRSGVVIGMTIFAVRAVVRPAEAVLYIVPSEEALVVEARIDVTSIDQVYPGQPARLRFSAFNQRTTPEIDATVRRISPDALADQQTGASHYVAEIAIDEAGFAALEGLTLVAGMPVEAFIQTGERSPLSYLMQPMTDFFSRSMREQ